MLLSHGAAPALSLLILFHSIQAIFSWSSDFSCAKTSSTETPASSRASDNFSSSSFFFCFRSSVSYTHLRAHET